jgi:hypothetical protein
MALPALWVVKLPACGKSADIAGAPKAKAALSAKAAAVGMFDCIERSSR